MKRLSTAWWGPPKKFSTAHRKRRVSWLELFYDLVYVIAISKITHHFSANISAGGFLEYATLFALIYWGWLNGSLHHDLHGNQGLRTRLMTLWQMMIVAALAVVLQTAEHRHYTGITIVLLLMQGFIIYLWWSVGIYDKEHRRYSRPYTSLYFFSLALMGLSLALPAGWLKLLVPLILLCNYAPPFLTSMLLKRAKENLDLSGSMFERLGLFTIIVFGELVLGIVNGLSALPQPAPQDWLNFALAVGLVFGMWWIFFTMIARREAKRNFTRASELELLYIPALLALGFLAAGFPAFFSADAPLSLQQLFGYGIFTFLFSVGMMMGLLVFPPEFAPILNGMRVSIFLTALVFLLLALLRPAFSATGYLAMAIVLLNGDIIYLNYVYYRQLARLCLDPPDHHA